MENLSPMENSDGFGPTDSSSCLSLECIQLRLKYMEIDKKCERNFNLMRDACRRNNGYKEEIENLSRQNSLLRESLRCRQDQQVSFLRAWSSRPITMHNLDS